MGLALGEPRDGDQELTVDGVVFLVSPEVQQWMSHGRPLHVDWSMFRQDFSVRFGSSSCC